MFKINKLSLVKKFFGADVVYIPNAVLVELSKGNFFKDFVSVINSDEKEITKERWVVILDVEAMDNENIGLGEREAIALARKLDAILLIDDQTAKKVAETEKLEAFDLNMFLQACKGKELIDPKEMKTIIEDLETKDFYKFKKEILKELLSQHSSTKK
ncbi:MAG: hypothetical protein U9Q22_01445 [Candidatus Altiarchaeota archaeon]|nr:hypothetical protein [Candidatus Altiarchaeota archaeon]